MSYEAAEKFEDEEQFEEAYKEYKKIYERKSGLQILERLGHLAMILNKKDDAQEYYTKILELDATNEMAYEQLMDICMSSDRYKYYIYRGNLHVIQQQLSHAVNDFKKALEKAQAEEEILSTRFVLANLYEQLDKPHQAIDEYLRIIDVENTNEIVYLKLANIYVKQDSLCSAIEILERAREHGFDTDNIKENLAELYLRNCQPESAGELTKDNLVKAKSLMEEGKINEAYKLLDAIKEDYKKNPKFHSLMAQYYFLTKKFDEALSSVNEFDKFEKNSPLTHQMRAMIYEEREDDFHAHINWAKYNLVRGDKDIALNDYMLAYQENSEDIELVTTLAALLDDMGDKNHAAEFYEKLAEIEPNNKKALERLYEFRESIGDYRAAADYLERYHEVDNKNARVIRNLGKIYEKLRNRDKALEYYNKYVSISSSVEDYDVIKQKIQKLEGSEMEADEGLIGKIMKLVTRT